LHCKIPGSQSYSKRDPVVVIRKVVAVDVQPVVEVVRVDIRNSCSLLLESKITTASLLSIQIYLVLQLHFMTSLRSAGNKRVALAV